MPGFTIHIAIAKQYLKKHKHEIKNEDEFLKGVIAPDLNDTMTEICKDKDKSHYGKAYALPMIFHFDSFLNDSSVDISKDYWKGYLLHLISDLYFYNKYFYDECLKLQQNNDNFYYDYDCLNRYIIEKYNIDILDNIKKYMNFIDEPPKYLNKSRIENFIEDISNLNLQDIISKSK